MLGPARSARPRSRKLIEVALPLVQISQAGAREKSLRRGHPQALHLWWARRPLATARAVLFAQLVDDPEDLEASPELRRACLELPAGDGERGSSPRGRLEHFLVELIRYERFWDKDLLDKAGELIRLSCRETPLVVDPFAGGFTIPLAAGQLGLPALGTDLNPVAVTIGKAAVEIPARFPGRPAVHPSAASGSYQGASGLATDLERYGKRWRQLAWEKLSSYYPPVYLPGESKGAAPLAYLWARTVPSPDPSLQGVEVPLLSSLVLSSKKGHETYLEPVQEGRSYRLAVRHGGIPASAKQGTVGRNGARCLLSGTAMPLSYLREMARAGRMGSKLIALVLAGPHGRVYLGAGPEQERLALSVPSSEWIPQGELPPQGKHFTTPNYGMTTYASLYTRRQLLALTTFSDLIPVVEAEVREAARRASYPEDPTPLSEGGKGGWAYAQAISVYLALLVDQMANRNSTLASWDSSKEQIRSVFSVQSLAMTWDYAEVNPFSGSSGSLDSLLSRQVEALANLGIGPAGRAGQADARSIRSRLEGEQPSPAGQPPLAPLPGTAGLAALDPALPGDPLADPSSRRSLGYPSPADSPAQAADSRGQLLAGSPLLFSTDPPYYDNIGYADLSDYFYVWLRSNLKGVFPKVFATLLTPKGDELVVVPHRQGSKEAGNRHFLEGMRRALGEMAALASPDFPLAIYYAFKQSEQGEGAVSPGWAAFLEALVQAGLQVSATWPLHTELSARNVARETNALASSVVLVCAPRLGAETGSYRDFLSELKRQLPGEIERLKDMSFPPADLAQAALGPGMALYSRYCRVLDASDAEVSVRQALGDIARVVESCLRGQEDLDPGSALALSYFSSYRFGEGPFSEAETLAKAKGVSLRDLAGAGVLLSQKGKVQLLSPEQLDGSAGKGKARGEGKAGDSAGPDQELPSPSPLSWVALHRLIWVKQRGGNQQAGKYLAQLPSPSSLRDLAYYLYQLCDQKGWAAEGRFYNDLIQDWETLSRNAREAQLEQEREKRQRLF
jgi:putative DNA methylase